MNVEIQLVEPEPSGGLRAVEAVYVGGKVPLDPCAAYALLQQWCLEHKLTADVTNTLVGYLQ